MFKLSLLHVNNCFGVTSAFWLTQPLYPIFHQNHAFSDARIKLSTDIHI